VASSATAFAPFSQNSARLLSAGSGQAHPGQSNPCVWLTLARVRAVRRTPICSLDIFRDLMTAGMPAATVLREAIAMSSSVKSLPGASLAMRVILHGAQASMGKPSRGDNRSLAILGG